ncbi:MAG: hypothetical protein M1383_02510 [Patescibacteria group bacterium]|nr:hypothetical protein [Patescibacteria group bacterium]
MTNLVFLGLLPLFGIGLVIIIIIAVIAAAKQKERSDMTLKKAYLYLVSVISLIIAVVGAIMLINLALKAWVFTKADQQYYGYPSCTAINTDGSKNISCDETVLAEQRKQAEENSAAQRQRDAAQAIAMIAVASPVWWYHWRMARKEA